MKQKLQATHKVLTSRLRLQHGRKGFTLIEVVLVLAISSLFAMVLIGLYSNQQKRARFTDAVEGVVSRLESTKTEVSSGFSTGDGGVSDPTGSRLFFGKAVSFTIGSGDLQVRAISADNSDTLDNLNFENQSTSTISWGVVFNGEQNNLNQVVFTRSLASSQLKTFILPATANLLSAVAYSGSSPASQAVLEFTDPDGLEATITIDATSGLVRSSYVN